MVSRTRYVALVSTALLILSVNGWQAQLRRARKLSRAQWWLHPGTSEACTSCLQNSTSSHQVEDITDLTRGQSATAVSTHSSSLALETSDANQFTSEASLRSVCFGGVGRLYSTKTAGAAKGKDATPSLPEGRAAFSDESVVLDRLQRATVVVVGVGGVGSWAAEALGRSGVGTIVLVDLDDVCQSNINRQLPALHSTVGQMKVDVLKSRLLDISPRCNVTCIHDFVSSDNIHDILGSVQPHRSETTPRPGGGRTVVLDATDGGADKAAIVAACVSRRIPIVVCGGAAGRTDPTSVRVSDLTRVQDDRLLQSLRRNLRRNHGFPEGAPFRKRQPGTWKIPAVHSTQKEASQGVGSSSSSSSSLRRCDSDLGTACFVTGSFGFAAAGCVVDMIANDKYKVPYVRH